MESFYRTNYHVPHTKKANNTLAFLRRNISRCSRDVNVRCYESLVRPNLEYTSSVWDPYIMSNIQQLEAVQRSVARFVRGDYHTTSSVSHMKSTIGWKSLQHRRQLSKCVMLYRITNQLVAIHSTFFCDYKRPLTRINDPILLNRHFEPILIPVYHKTLEPDLTRSHQPYLGHFQGKGCHPGVLSTPPHVLTIF